MIESINTWHSIQQRWEEGVVAPEERTPRSRFDRMREEVEELDESINELDGTLDKQLAAGYEAADVMIVCLGVMDALGFDAERLVSEKLGINFKKYSAHGNAQLRANGHSHSEARQIQKKQWIKP